MASIRFITPKGKLVTQKSKADRRKVGKVWEYRMQMQFRTGKKDNKRRQWIPDLPDSDCMGSARAYVARESGLLVSSGNHSWDDVFEDWKIQKDPQERTVYDFSLVKKAVEERFVGCGPWDISRQEMASWLKKKASDTSGRTANKYLANMRAMVNVSATLNGLKPAPWIDIPNFEHVPAKRKDIKSADLDNYIKALKDERVRLPILMLLFTGERNSAICGLTWDDLGGDRFTVTKKGGKQREILYTPIIKEIIKQAKKLWQDYGKPTHTVFFNRKNNPWSAWDLDRTVGKLFHDAKLPHITPHQLRHTFTTRAQERGLAPASIAAALGHENINTQQIYTHLNPEEGRKAMEEVGDQAFGDLAKEYLGYEKTPEKEKAFTVKCPHCKKSHKIKASDL
jgi:integrase/recombinase XerC